MRAEMTQVVLEYLKVELLGPKSAGDLGFQDDLLGSGLLDSLGVIQLVQFVERKFGIRVPPGDVTIENFGTVEFLVEYLQGCGASDESHRSS